MLESRRAGVRAAVKNRRGRPSFAPAERLARAVRGSSAKKIDMAEHQAVASGHVDSASPDASLPDTHSKASFWTLMLGSIGVVFGDIGTCPLYAFKESMAAAADGGPVHTRHHHGRAVADPLVPRPRGDPQIRVHPAARRQQGRRRHAYPGGARPARHRQAPGAWC